MDIKIPDDWTPEQATAVFKFIEEIEDTIWIQYQLQIMAQLHPEYHSKTEPDRWNENLEKEESNS